MKPEFRNELEKLINKHSIEGVVNMPDFILADMICKMLDDIGESVKKRDTWLGYRNRILRPVALEERQTN
jgi:hypothetical protein